MKAMLKNKFLVVSILTLALFMSYSCEEPDVYTFPEAPESELTILELMRKDPDFANFLYIVDLCGAECADSLFNQSRVYTVFASVNESYDVATVEERIANGDREGVFKEFVTSHVANNRHAANGQLGEDNTLLMLNGKLVEFSGDARSGYTFGTSKLLQTNIMARNGVIHKLSAPASYKPSLWESIKNVNSISAFWDFCLSFTKREFDKNSPQGDPVNQQPTYIDSLFIETNEMLNIMGSINNEDSTMVMYAPTDELWNSISDNILSFYNYRYESEFLSKMDQEEIDSISMISAQKQYLKYFTYSLSDQRVDGAVPTYDNLPDSMIARNGLSYPRKKFARNEFSVTETHVMSNGMLNVVDAMPLNPFNLWIDTIKFEPDLETVEDEDKYHTYLRESKGGSTYRTVSVAKLDQNPDVVGKLSNGQYFEASCAEKKANLLPVVKFFVKNIYSANYKIALITPPWFIKSYKDTIVDPANPTNPGANYPKYRKSYLRVSVMQNNELLGMFPSDSVKLRSGGYRVLETSAITPDTARIDTIFLKDENGEDKIFKFDYCENFGNLSELGDIEDKEYTVEIKIELLEPAYKRGSQYMAINNNRYAHRFLLDQILLIPVDPNEEESGTEDEPLD